MNNLKKNMLKLEKKKKKKMKRKKENFLHF